MRIATVQTSRGPELAVAVGDDSAVLLSTVWPEGPRDMLEAMQVEAEIERRVAASGGAGAVPVASLAFLPPIPRPGKVICLALNNSANSTRIMKGPSHPAMFNKPNSSLLGHGRPIRLREGFGRVHPEPELVVVIGKGGADIASADAYGHVFGYTIMNDLTSPTMREDDSFNYRAIHPDPKDPEKIEYIDTWVSYPGRYKGSDGFGPIGPWIATRAEVPDPHALTVTCTHQGRVVTQDTTENLTYKVPEVIAYVSYYMTLEAGDIISMGTALKAAGGSGRAVQTVDLNTLGGPIDVTISRIGTLSNPVEHRS